VTSAGAAPRRSTPSASAAGPPGAREMDQESKREAWLLASGMILVPLVAAIAVFSQMLLQ
jgi:hypothetical protein